MISLFLSTPSVRRATIPGEYTVELWKISIHALREEGDFTAAVARCYEPDFYPRPP